MKTQGISGIQPRPPSRKPGHTPNCYELFGQYWSTESLRRTMRHLLRELYNRRRDGLRSCAMSFWWLEIGGAPPTGWGHRWKPEIGQLGDDLWYYVGGLNQREIKERSRDLLRRMGFRRGEAFRIHKFDHPDIDAVEKGSEFFFALAPPDPCDPA